jgi:hypothetical protein
MILSAGFGLCARSSARPPECLHSGKEVKHVFYPGCIMYISALSHINVRP